jgi:predicted nucleic acid-binding protein
MVSQRIVVDTSVVFKWFVAWGEDGLTESMELLEAHRDGATTLMAPSTMLVEVANTLRYLLPDTSDSLGFLEDLASTHIVLFDPTPNRVKQATIRATETGIGVYDALFLVLAEELDCPLATADAKAFAGVDTPITVRLML